MRTLAGGRGRRRGDSRLDRRRVDLEWRRLRWGNAAELSATVELRDAPGAAANLAITLDFEQDQVSRVIADGRLELYGESSGDVDWGVRIRTSAAAVGSYACDEQTTIEFGGLGPALADMEPTPWSSAMGECEVTLTEVGAVGGRIRGSFTAELVGPGGEGMGVGAIASFRVGIIDLVRDADG